MSIRRTTLAALAATLLSTPVHAQRAGDGSGDGLDLSIAEVSRGAADLRAVLVPRPDTDSIDTALVFTNPGSDPSVVVCAGRNAEGAGTGRARTEVPPHGVRIIFASDISNGADFVGSALCKARNRVIPSAFVVGSGLSDAPARLHRGWDSTEMSFPVVATF